MVGDCQFGRCQIRLFRHIHFKPLQFGLRVFQGFAEAMLAEPDCYTTYDNADCQSQKQPHKQRSMIDKIAICCIKRVKA